MIYTHLEVSYDELENHYLLQVWSLEERSGIESCAIFTETNFIDAKAAVEMIMLQLQPEPPAIADKVTDRWG